MLIVFVHGWSVTDTSTYGELPGWLASLSAGASPDGQPMKVADIHLGKYISFEDTVRIDDISRAFEQAIHTQVESHLAPGERFAAITHSTGGPVVRNWIQLYYKDRLAQCPLRHLVMLAPANHGSALAQLGKSRLSRMKSFFEGAEPGVEVLNWLELGSPEAWTLNRQWMDLDLVGAGIFPFVLTGQTIDRSVYDVLNAYTGEAGSDGVVRVAGANLNYGYLKLIQDGPGLQLDPLHRTRPTALAVVPGRSHSGKDIGIIRSITMANAPSHPTVVPLMDCLKVRSGSDYANVCQKLDALTSSTQRAEHTRSETRFLVPRTYTTPRFSMLIFRIVDDRGWTLDDYDLYLTAGPNYSEHDLPEGFFEDRQRNQRCPGTLTYYVDHDILDAGLKGPALEGRLGFRLKARPEQDPAKPRLVFYRELDYRGTAAEVDQFLKANETLMVEIQLQRQVDAAVFQIENTLVPSPISSTPTGRLVP